jgi:plasmid stability protein
MRTTLTIDEDVAAKLKAEARRTGKAFRDVVNEALRAGLTPARRPRRQEPFKVVARDLGSLKPGLNLDSVANLLEQAEGPLHR